MLPQRKKTRRTVLYRDGLIFMTITAVLFLGSVAREVNLLLFFASMLTTLLFLDFIMGRRSLRKLFIHRSLPTSIHAGDSFLITISLENLRKKKTVWSILVEDLIIPDPSVYGKSSLLGKHPKFYKPACYFEEVRSGNTIRKTYAGQLPLRGKYNFKSLTISTRFPLGFFRCARIQNETASILVFPKIGRLTERWFNLYRLQSEERNRSRNAVSRTSNELAGIRNWQSGDTRKWIHWPASAKHQKILVRQFEEMQNQDIAIILDLYQPKKATLESFENNELAVSFAATLIRDFSRMLSGSAHFTANGMRADDNKAPVLSGKVGLPLVQSIMEDLAQVQSTDEDHLAERLQDLFTKIQGNNTNIILVTTAPFDPTVSNRLDAVRSGMRFNHCLSKLIVVDCSAPDFSNVFEANL